MKIYLATDHAGFEAKEKVKTHLTKEGYDVEDCGAYSFDKEDDYPDFIKKAAEAVSRDPKGSRAIIFGGSGQGEAIVANKFPGVRSIIFYSPAIPVDAADASGRTSNDQFEIIRLGREHNNANVLSLGVRFLTEEQVKKAIDLFLKTSFSGEERHARRIGKIEEIEQEN